MYTERYSIRKCYCSVVTGVRIREMYDMIYLQIQVGKLLPMGMIDQDTVYWQELPKNPGDEHTANVKVILSGHSFDDAIVVGNLLLHFRKLKISKQLKAFEQFVLMGSLDLSSTKNCFQQKNFEP